MIEDIAKDILLAGVSIAKDILGNRLKEKNAELLERKKEQLKEREKAKSRAVSPEQLAQLALDPNEQATGSVHFVADDMQASLRSHIKEVRQWSKEVGFSELHVAKDLGDLYVELETWLTPLGNQVETEERDNTIPLMQSLLQGKGNSIVLGQPGSGKTTSMKRLCDHLLSEDALQSNPRIPILVRFRFIAESSGRDVILNAITSVLKLSVAVANVSPKEGSELVQPSVLAAVDALAPIVILDGFDELPSYAMKQAAIDELYQLFNQLKKTKFILTCRSGEFNYNLPRSASFEIAPLKPEQIHSFAKNWLETETKAIAFVKAIESSPYYDTMRRPLALAHLCAIFERVGRVPDRPKTIYRKIVGLLLEEWDEQRRIKRDSVNVLLETDRRIEFLAHFSYEVTSQTGLTIFDRSTFFRAYHSICQNFSLSDSKAAQVFAEIESHTGLLLRCGYDKYEFAHKSLQEFLAAEYLVKLPRIPSDAQVLQRIPNELAISVATSSNPSAYFCEIVLSRLCNSGLPPQFFDTFVSRLMVERPDFYPFEDMILAINILQTLWVCEGKVTGRLLQSRRIDENSLERFTLFRHRVESVGSSGKLGSYYSGISDEVVHLGKVALMKAKRRRQHPTHNLPSYILIPALSGDA